MKQGKLFFLFLVVVSGVRIHAEQNKALADEFIETRGYSNSIVFDATNIKRYWVDNSVFGKNNKTYVLLNKNRGNVFKSLPFPFQFVNVDETMDCRVDIISKNQIDFSVLDAELKPVASSHTNDTFNNYNVSSHIFHLENISQPRINLQFSSKNDESLTFDKIVISFFPNKNTSFLSSPGRISLTKDDFEMISAKNKSEQNNAFSISATENRGTILSKKKILVSENILSYSVKVKNTGNTPVTVRVGYALYTRERRMITSRNTIYNNKNQVFHVLSSEKHSKSIVVDTYPDCCRYCFLALDAKEDLSDFPNFNFSESSIDSVKRIEDGKAEIVFRKPLRNAIKKGTTVRVQRPTSWEYLFLGNKKIGASEEVVFKSSIQKDDTFYQFSPQALCKGVYCVSPVILFEPVKQAGIVSNNSIKISDYIIQY